jgi:hypothetical protein
MFIKNGKEVEFLIKGNNKCLILEKKEAITQNYLGKSKDYFFV